MLTVIGLSVPVPPSPDALASRPSVEGLEGFSPWDGGGKVAAGSPPTQYVRPRSSGWAPTANTAVVEYPGAGPVRPPSPWAVAGLLPVGVLLGSGVYSTWCRRRQGPL